MKTKQGLSKNEFWRAMNKGIDDYPKFIELMNITEESNCFTLKETGELFYGDRVMLIRLYLVENPSAKFRTWLFDRGLNIPADKL